MIADLHLHTNRSDGSLTPRAVVSACKALKINVIAITDHDSVGGLDEAIQAGEEKGVKVIPAIEMSSFSDKEVHILGYNIDYKNPLFLQELKVVQERREMRNLEIIDNLKRIGINLNYAFMKKGNSTVGRMHIALQMRDKGYVYSVNEAFDKYIGFGKQCYVKTSHIKPEVAVDIIKRYGGVAVLAHPFRFVEEKCLREFILSVEGISGVEVYYPLHTESIRQELICVADEFKLITTGGSDFHSPYAGNPIGAGNYIMNEKAKEILLR